MFFFFSYNLKDTNNSLQTFIILKKQISNAFIIKMLNYNNNYKKKGSGNKPQKTNINNVHAQFVNYQVSNFTLLSFNKHFNIFRKTTKTSIMFVCNKN